MNEAQAILKALELSQQNGETVFLATLVKAQGSTYRRPGARMLMTSKGRMVGTISGGCLENDVFERTQQVMHSGKPIVVKYDTSSQEDIIWGLGLGCNGMVQVLIERVELDNELSPFAFLSQCLQYKQQVVVATVFYVEGKVRVEVGDRCVLRGRNKIANIEDLHLSQAILTDARSAQCDRQSCTKTYKLSTGRAEVFIEVIQPPTSLVIFGAGHDAVPVAHFAKALGWDVTVVDSRANTATHQRFPFVDNIILTRPETAQQQLCVNERTVAVVMTHNYLHDLELLKMLLESAVSYIGVLGSKQRSEKLLQDLHARSIGYTQAQLQRLYAPVGIDIGADTPQEIAIAIVAEIQAVLANRQGGLLRDRASSIHPRYDDRITIVSERHYVSI
ncbi:MAG: putative xanthine dehydrogenase subunit A [Chroococcidiopsis cubana SAG 39.79]|nr:putative xanthine dehydrogenase subunit A [Chroococcidiopsis cubana SAG 39.79]PSB65741.1 xanthine dehydrogenase [Chroococcidiopsis cubana CCALA 043]